MSTLTALHIHPIKSCRGNAVPEAAFDRFGLVGDRRLLVVDAQGRFLTQRTEPRMALIDPTVSERAITLTAPGVPALEIAARPDPLAPVFDVTIWHDTVSAIDLGPEAASWLTAWLRQPARLVAMAPEFRRPVRSETGRPGDESAFADAFPLLVISEDSLEDLNQRLDAPVPMNRFRPNLVVRGCAPYAEDAWKRIRIGDAVLRAAGPCARCVVTTTDQQTLERGKEPLRTLAQYRRGPKGEVNFGQNYIHETKHGTIRVGMPIEVLE